MSDRVPEDLPGRMPENMPEDMPDRMPDRMPEDMSDRMPEDMPDRMPEDLPDRMPEDMPDRMPNRMSEDMSDRMPEDVPVRTCINVMVGITRSKVILLTPRLYEFTQCYTKIPWCMIMCLIKSDMLGSTPFLNRPRYITVGISGTDWLEVPTAIYKAHV